MKNKLKNKLYIQGQTYQTAQMMEKHIKLRDKHSDKDLGMPKTNFLMSVSASQPALYDAKVMLTPNHAPPNSWSDKELDDLESANREKFDNKIKDPKCIKHRVIVKPHDYYEQNRVTVFAPQTKLTPEQVFWPLDVEKMKAEELKAKFPQKLAAPTLYPPNTPMNLVQFSLPTQCKTLISIYVLCQMFTDFDKTCKKRITPTGITEGERGFELTKECYLTKVIPFFKLIKEHFEGLR